MSSLKLGGAFSQAIFNLVLPILQDSNQVGLVMRWNEDDNLLWTFWSKKKGQDIVPGGGACHAEEVMLAQWGKCLVEADLTSPDIVEIFLSQSPCFDRSQARQFLGTYWPQGCINKIEALVSCVESDVKAWRISYFRVYQEGQRLDALALGALSILDRLSKVDCYWYKERHKALW